MFGKHNYERLKRTKFLSTDYNQTVLRLQKEIKENLFSTQRYKQKPQRYKIGIVISFPNIRFCISFLVISDGPSAVEKIIRTTINRLETLRKMALYMPIFIFSSIFF